jgi:hypothetical protein
MSGAGRPLRAEQRADGVLALWLDRPEARNALDHALVLATGLLPALDAERAGNAPWSGSVEGLARP